jgi:uncharacterized protein
MTTLAMPKPTAEPARTQAKSGPRPFANPYVAGGLLGLVLFLAFYVTGNGLGASGGLARFIVWVIANAAPDQVGQKAYLLEYEGGIRNALDYWIVLLTAGIFIGGVLSGWFNHRIKLETIHGPRITARQRWLLAFAGGILSGYGARLARGCTSSQGLSGAATLSVGSWAFLLAFFAGGYLLAYFMRRLWT